MNLTKEKLAELIREELEHLIEDEAYRSVVSGSGSPIVVEPRTLYFLHRSTGKRGDYEYRSKDSVRVKTDKKFYPVYVTKVQNDVVHFVVVPHQDNRSASSTTKLPRNVRGGEAGSWEKFTTVTDVPEPAPITSASDLRVRRMSIAKFTKDLYDSYYHFAPYRAAFANIYGNDVIRTYEKNVSDGERGPLNGKVRLRNLFKRK